MSMTLSVNRIQGGNLWRGICGLSSRWSGKTSRVSIVGTSRWSWIRRRKAGEGCDPRGAQHEHQAEAEQQVEVWNELGGLGEWSTDCIDSYSFFSILTLHDDNAFETDDRTSTSRAFYRKPLGHDDIILYLINFPKHCLSGSGLSMVSYRIYHLDIKNCA